MIYVLGSINREITVEVEKLPKKGETVIADACRTCLGGRGANQAVAIARLAPRSDTGRKGEKAVKMIGHVGKDSAGAELIARLDELGVDTEFVRKVNRGTGVAVVAASGSDRRVMMYNGANLGLSKTDVDEALAGATDSDMLLCQLEVPMYVVGYALRKARAIGMTTVVNPAPAKEIPEDFYSNIDIIVANETQTQALTGVNPRDRDSRYAALNGFHVRGVHYAVITLGAHGASLSDGERIIAHIDACKTEVVDTTCAGVTFLGALALTYPHIGMYSFKEACLFATRAASIAVSRHGGEESIPTFDEVCELYNSHIKK